MLLTDDSPTTNAVTEVGESPHGAPTTSVAGVRRVEFPARHFTGFGALVHIGRMGRFSSLLLVLLAACTDNADDPVYGDPPVDEVQPKGTATAIPHYVPTVCGTQSWSTNVAG